VSRDALPLRERAAITPRVRASVAEIQRLAERIVETLLKQGHVKAKAEKSVLSRRIVELMMKNFDEEAAIEADAEKMAQQHIRRSAGGAGMDERRVIDLIKKKLAEERGFSL
jgi:hypothetical protein